MILEYHRPKTIEEALELLNRERPKTVPLGGGTVLANPYHPPVAVVDLQNLALNRVDIQGVQFSIGAGMTLQELLNAPGLPPSLAPVISYEATYNLRQMATVAGTLVASDGRSPLTTAFMAVDARLTLLPGDEGIKLGDLLPLRDELLKGRLITAIGIPTNNELSFQQVARTPADRPILCLAMSRWPSGRTRVALGGWGTAPVMAFDGNEPGGLETAVEDALSNATDEWASAEYRQHVAVRFVQRGLERE